ncbi:MAG: 3'(2'),5'-bisphosphate nucleotidase CysQ [Acidimicrobiales bacterium]|nr:3'(2'),5'-bisphosphate nucleotidase CysQ [Acidimicrobiales bacterium]
MPETTSEDHSLAAQLATEAGRLLVELRARLVADDPHLDPKALGREGDRRAHDLLVARLAAARPGDAVLSEEGLADEARLTAGRVWIVDPLDGTREFGEVPRTDWAVHVALVVGGEAVAGAVALPGRDLTLATNTPPPTPPAWAGPPRIVVSRSRPPAEAARVADALGGELVPLGSAGAKAMAVVLGDADVYAHSGGQYEWDSAAPVAVARAAGLHVSRLDGSPLVYNRPDPYLPDLLVCRAELADAVIAAARG